MSIASNSNITAQPLVGSKIHVSEHSFAGVQKWKTFILGTPFIKKDDWHVEVVGMGVRKVYLTKQGRAYIKQQGNRVYCDPKSEDEYQQHQVKQQEDKKKKLLAKLKEHESHVAYYKMELGMVPTLPTIEEEDKDYEFCDVCWLPKNFHDKCDPTFRNSVEESLSVVLEDYADAGIDEKTMKALIKQKYCMS